LNDRVDESLSGTAFVSLHLNQTRSKKAKGLTVYAFGKDTFRSRRGHHHHRRVPPLAAPSKEQARASGVLADAIARSLRAQGYDAETARADFYVLKNPSIPSVLIELGFLSNPEEGAKLGDPTYQDRLAQAVALSLQAYALETASARMNAAASFASSGGR
jgi:N-acetylmuramoyl-L-alanine amidase